MNITNPTNSAYMWSKSGLQTKFTFGRSLNVFWVEEMTLYKLAKNHNWFTNEKAIVMLFGGSAVICIQVERTYLGGYW